MTIYTFSTANRLPPNRQTLFATAFKKNTSCIIPVCCGGVYEKFPTKTVIFGTFEDSSRL